MSQDPEFFMRTLDAFIASYKLQRVYMEKAYNQARIILTVPRLAPEKLKELMEKPITPVQYTFCICVCHNRGANDNCVHCVDVHRVEIWRMFS